jgi:drug/metabolite transporter (DMT)-like permease
MTASISALSPKNTIWYGWFLAFFNVLLFSIGPPLTKFIIIAGVDPLTLIAIRYVITTLLLGLTLRLTRPDSLRIDRRGLLICMSGGLIFAVSFLMFASSLVRISASIASMIVALTPLLVLVILALRGEKFTQRNLLRITLGLGGVYLLIGVGGQVDFTGVLLAFGTAITYAFYLLVIQALKDYDGHTILFYVFGTIALFGLVVWSVQGPAWQTPSGSTWLAIAALVIFTTYLAQLCLFIAIRYIGSGQMALLNPAEIFLTIVWSVLFLQERLSLVQWLGGGLILFSMVLAIKRLHRAQRFTWRPRLRLRL